MIMFKTTFVKYKFTIIDILLNITLAYVLNAIFNIDINTWFIILWITLFIQIIFRILHKHNLGLSIPIKIEPLFIQIIVGMLVSILFNK